MFHLPFHSTRIRVCRAKFCSCLFAVDCSQAASSSIVANDVCATVVTTVMLIGNTRRGNSKSLLLADKAAHRPSTVQSHSSGRFQTFCVAKTKTEEGDLPKYPADLVPKIT